jgi:hypothetical protein
MVDAPENTFLFYLFNGSDKIRESCFTVLKMNERQEITLKNWWMRWQN